MENPLVAILIPSCDSAATLGRCLDSALGQNYPELMVAVLDNRSTDGSYDLLLDYEKRHRDRLYTGRTFARLSVTEHRHRILGLVSPRTRLLQYLDPTAVLAPTQVARCVERLEEDERIGCVLTQAGVLRAGGALAPMPRLLDSPRIAGEDLMRLFMERGLDVHAQPLYRTEIFRLHLAEALTFNRFPEWLPMLMASSIADFAYIADPLVLRGDPQAILGEAFIPSLESRFEHYIFLQAFQGIAARLDQGEVCAGLPGAVARLGRDCLRCAGLLQARGDAMAARAHASLALTFLPELAESPEYQPFAGAEA